MSRLYILVIIILMSLASSVYAMPSFSRQMGVSCNACHSQNAYPSLNAFGRQFKASGYTMLGKQGMIENSKKENFLSLPETLNASFVVKIRGKDGDGSARKLEFPDEAAVVIGGRISEHVGSFIEVGYDSADDKFGLANFKLPITYTLENYTLGFVPYRTDGFGPSASFEVLNTGAVRNARVLEERKVISAQQYIGTASKAEGLGLYLYTDMWNIVYSAWVPTNGTINDYAPANYARVAFTPQFGAWDIGFGGQAWWGTAKRDHDGNSLTPRLEEKTDAFAIDFQAMGSVNELPLSFFLTYASAKNDPLSIYNKGVDTKSAITFLSEVAISPSVLMVSAGYRDADNGKASDSSEDAGIIGIKYFLMENVEFQLDYTHYLDQSTNNNQILFMLYSAF